MVDIADYVVDYRIDSQEAYDTARYMLLDSLACAALAMDHAECVKHLGPLVPGAVLPGGARVPFTTHELDPVQAAYNIGVQIRWLDFNDTWLAAEWGHPSDNLGAILAVADYLGRKAEAEGGQALTVRDVLGYAIKAHEIQGCYALKNSFNRVGLDHVILVRLASTAVATAMLGGGKDEIVTAVSHSWIDNGVLRTYRHAPNTGPRKSWAAGDACRRAVTHALNAVKGVVGYPSALSVPTWGFYDIAFKGKPFEFERPFGSYVMENILFKISFPAEFHAQTAVECAHEAAPAGQGQARRGRHRRHRQDRHPDPGSGHAHHRQDRTAGELRRPRPLPAVHGRRAAAVRPPERRRLQRCRRRRSAHRRAAREDDGAGEPAVHPGLFRSRQTVYRQLRSGFLQGRHARPKRFRSIIRSAIAAAAAKAFPLLMAKFEAAIRAKLPPAQVEQLLALAADPGRLEALPITRFMALLKA